MKKRISKSGVLLASTAFFVLAFPMSGAQAEATCYTVDVNLGGWPQGGGQPCECAPAYVKGQGLKYTIHLGCANTP
jgi:hypothetical protein